MLPQEKESVLNTLDAAIHKEIPVRSEGSRGL
jgi:hypothetical protein